MNYQDWTPLFGLPANDPKVVSALAARGFTGPVTLEPDESSTSVDLKQEGLSVGFNSEFSLNGGVADLPILSTIVMMTILGKTAKNWTAYTGPLPHGLTVDTSKDEALALLGEPENLDEDYESALWLIDGQELGVTFTEDWKRIKQLGLSLPGAV